MTECKRQGQFREEEFHRCFILGCNSQVHPTTSNTCSKCNWKKCEKGHCGCDLDPKARYAVDTLYKTLCENCL